MQDVCKRKTLLLSLWQVQCTDNQSHEAASHHQGLSSLLSLVARFVCHLCTELFSSCIQRSILCWWFTALQLLQGRISLFHQDINMRFVWCRSYLSTDCQVLWLILPYQGCQAGSLYCLPGLEEKFKCAYGRPLVLRCLSGLPCLYRGKKVMPEQIHFGSLAPALWICL